ncbi:MAG: hypothetical protein WCO61_10870 [Alphaproteobacteria bacterium]
MIPPFNGQGIIPPFLGTDATNADRSPYFTNMKTLFEQLGTSPIRRQLLRGLIEYRKILANDGYVNGVQFIDGSFVENVESHSKRPPSDIDIFSILNIPQKYYGNIALWDSHGRPFFVSEVADRNKNKIRFKVDTYAILYEEQSPFDLIKQIIYWYSVFSHQKATFAWKGFVAIMLDPQLDKSVLTLLEGE